MDGSAPAPVLVGSEMLEGLSKEGEKCLQIILFQNSPKTSYEETFGSISLYCGGGTCSHKS